MTSTPRPGTAAGGDLNSSTGRAATGGTAPPGTGPNRSGTPCGERHEHRPVKAAVTVTADDLLDDNAHPDGGRLLKVANTDPDAPRPDVWNDHLALWAAHAAERRTAPLAVRGEGVRTRTRSRPAHRHSRHGEDRQHRRLHPARLHLPPGRRRPPPQVTVNGRSLWSRPVAEDWAEQRRRSPEGAAATLASGDDDNLPVGASDLRQRLSRLFFNVLWERPDRRKRWALRHRTEPAVHEVAHELAYTVAANTNNIIDISNLAATIRHAFLDEFATGRELDQDIDAAGTFYGITHTVAEMLDWLVRHHPKTAQQTIAEIIGDAERRWNTPRDVSARSIRTALSLDSKLDKQARIDWLDLVLPRTPR